MMAEVMMDGPDGHDGCDLGESMAIPAGEKSRPDGEKSRAYTT